MERTHKINNSDNSDQQVILKFIYEIKEKEKNDYFRSNENPFIIKKEEYEHTPSYYCVFV